MRENLMEAFNLANHVNLLAPDGTFVPGADGRNRSATFGTITAARDVGYAMYSLRMNASRSRD